MGRSVGYACLLKRLTAIWRPKARMELVTVDNDYYLVKFSLVDDYEFAKYGGPWMVLDQYLIVKEWIPNFDPFTDKTERMIVWIRFTCLPAEYFDHKFFMRVGEKIGRPINIDMATSLVSKASFARVCVEVDITKPLLAKFTLRNKVRPLVYEGLHQICFKCGTYGHTVETCSLNHAEHVSHGSSADDSTRPEEASGASNGNKDGQKGREQGSGETSLIRPEIMEDYGTWMIAPKRKRNYTKNQENRNQGARDYGKKNHEGKDQERTANGKKIKQSKGTNTDREGKGSGSRYATLAEDNMHEEVYEGNMEDQSNGVSNEQPKQGESSKPGVATKGKRASVQASEKQIEGNNKHGTHKKQPVQNKQNPPHVRREQTQRTNPNRAAAENEHTLVTGDKNGATTSHVVRLDEGDQSNCIPIEELTNPEHHGDPPETRLGDSSTVADEDAFLDSF
ncbi:uncharacterized protein LOC116015971 [Ipomoea triloba]|uniref:uncharacterized protein LOC116015971 n=1 Tax=Ipomoea triloba TaxID=35885 RepID=UPI00125E3B89|nr:uncharacterized protein LOC116015971 [Ipomoea triloba]